MGSVHYKLTADEKRAVDALNKVMAKQDQVNRKFRQTKQTSKEAGFSVEDFAKKAAGLASVGAAAAVIAKAFKETDVRAKAAADRIAGMTPHLKALLGMTDKLQAGELLTSKLRMSYGFGEQEAADFYNKMKAVGFSDEEVLGDVGKLRMIESRPLDVGMAVKKLRTKFGKDVFGGTAASQSSALGIAGAASQSTAADIANIALGPMGVGKELGFKPAAMLAAVAHATLDAPTPAEGGTQVQALFKAMLKNRERFEGKSLDEALGVFAGMSKEERLKILGGRMESLLGLSLLGPKRGQIQGLAGDIREGARVGGTEQGFLARKARLAAEHPGLSAQLTFEQSEAFRELTMSVEAIREKFEQSMLSTTRGHIQERRNAGDIRDLGQWWSERLLGMYDVLNWRDPKRLAGALSSAVGGEGWTPRGQQDESTLGRLLEPIIQRWENAIEKQQKLLDDTMTFAHTVNPDVRSEGY